ncbi:hypothetical protein ANHYDRO_00857 [Anaerococcus hydrogenalis DSM 7454]|uniref:Uncharacterized protein n=1 Tax=Anaerococcus hydrogenalis DSM 7454 TaxID=561177 RepID=B6W8M9_9FIRM|nr:hypothetical protein [Anaerococcus hydrogenalis]EEB36205.1 hypothetical protein ANHYDRO_00857 [Anaerococcus hydrogenalis DSM 7454]
MEIIPKIPIKTRKMTLKFKDKKNESRSLPSGKNYMFVDGKLIREIDGFSDRIENFEYEVGKNLKLNLEGRIRLILNYWQVLKMKCQRKVN